MWDTMAEDTRRAAEMEKISDVGFTLQELLEIKEMMSKGMGGVVLPGGVGLYTHVTLESFIMMACRQVVGSRQTVKQSGTESAEGRWRRGGVFSGVLPSSLV
jgi:hypothetical protein